MKKLASENNGLFTKIAAIFSHNKLKLGKKVTWILSGNIVLHLYSNALGDLISSKYNEPKVIDIIVCKALFKKLNASKTIIKIKDTPINFVYKHDDLYISIILDETGDIINNSVKTIYGFNVINLDDLLLIKKMALQLNAVNLMHIFYDVDYIANLILLQATSNKTITDKKIEKQVIKKLKGTL